VEKCHDPGGPGRWQVNAVAILHGSAHARGTYAEQQGACQTAVSIRVRGRRSVASILEANRRSAPPFATLVERFRWRDRHVGSGGPARRLLSRGHTRGLLSAPRASPGPAFAIHPILTAGSSHPCNRIACIALTAAAYRSRRRHPTRIISGTMAAGERCWQYSQ